MIGRRKVLAPILGALLGAASGALVPLPGAGGLGVSPSVAPDTSAERPAPVRASGPCEDAAHDQRRASKAALKAAEAHLASLTAQFTRDWGEPVPEPDGWEAALSAEALDAQADTLPLLEAFVDCSYYPCVVVLAHEEHLPASTIADAFGVEPDSLRVGNVVSDSRTLTTTGFPVPERPLMSDAQVRWANELRLRLSNRVSRELADAAQD